MHMRKNETDKRNATKEILHIIEKLPQDFEGCQEVSNVCEKLAKRVIVIVDISDLLPRAAKNSVYHGLELMGLFTSSAH